MPMHVYVYVYISISISICIQWGPALAVSALFLLARWEKKKKIPSENGPSLKWKCLQSKRCLSRKIKAFHFVLDQETLPAITVALETH